MNASEPERHASRTALAVAMLRAAHQMLDGRPKILDDPIAGPLLGDEICRKIIDHPDRAQEPGVKEMRARVVLRSRYAEDRLAEAVRRSVHQHVILGAGFDTFAYRQPEWAHALHIFEVDHPGSQGDKRRRLERAGISTPANLEFVAIDFESVSLHEGLSRSGLDFARPAFFSCLGVLMYLTRDAADAVFQLVAGFPAGSEIAFTFTTPDAARSDLADKVSALGEPWQTHFDPDALVSDLRALGFSEIAILPPDIAQQMYFQDRTDGLRASRRGRIATAVVGSNK